MGMFLKLCTVLYILLLLPINNKFKILIYDQLKDVIVPQSQTRILYIDYIFIKLINTPDKFSNFLY